MSSWPSRGGRVPIRRDNESEHLDCEIMAALRRCILRYERGELVRKRGPPVDSDVLITHILEGALSEIIVGKVASHLGTYLITQVCRSKPEGLRGDAGAGKSTAWRCWTASTSAALILMGLPFLDLSHPMYLLGGGTIVATTRFISSHQLTPEPNFGTTRAAPVVRATAPRA